MNRHDPPHYTWLDVRDAYSKGFHNGQEIGMSILIGITAMAEFAIRSSRASKVHYRTLRTKPLAELTAADIPRGLDPEDVATDVPHICTDVIEGTWIMCGEGNHYCSPACERDAAKDKT